MPTSHFRAQVSQRAASPEFVWSEVRPSGTAPEPSGGVVTLYVPVLQTQGVSLPSARLKEQFEKTVADLLRAETIRRQRDWLVAWFESPTTANERGELVEALDRLFSDHPIEDGLVHPGEAVLDKWLCRHPGAGLAVLAELVGDAAYPHRVELLRCLGRMPFRKVQDRAAGILRSALRSEDVGLRDAAVRAVELWHESQMAGILREHREPIAWLRDYIIQVVATN